MIIILGFSLTGSSIAKYLLSKKIKFDIYDVNKQILLPENFDGEFYFDEDKIDYEKYDLVIKSPGIPPSNKIIQSFELAGKTIVSDIEYFYQSFNPKNLIAITGTNGKTTVTNMISKFLEDRHPIKGGNIGLPIFDYVNSNEDDIFILEVSSFQLENTISFKPHISVLLNIEEDHTDWHGNFENYRKAKMKIFKNQTQEDYLVIDSDRIDINTLETKSKICCVSLKNKVNYGAYLDGGSLIFNVTTPNIIIDIDELIYKEPHNISNFAVSAICAILMGANKETIIEKIKHFKLDSHRLENIGVFKGVTAIDDSKATNPSAVVKAVEGMLQPTILLLGGYDKNTDFDDLLKYAYPRTKKMIYFGNIKNKLKDRSDELEIDYLLADNLRNAVAKAMEIAVEGDVILLSPGASSYDEFKNYEDRGIKFLSYLEEIDEK